MQFQVPQFIETEDKIIGGIFTLKQFAYLAAAGAVIFTLFFLAESLAVWVMLSLPFVVVAFAFAFYKPYGQPLSRFFLSMLHYFWSPQTYTWQSKEKVRAPARAKEEAAPRAGLQELLTSIALKKTWEKLQTKTESESPQKQAERYETFYGVGGQRQAARRIDYR